MQPAPQPAEQSATFNRTEKTLFLAAAIYAAVLLSACTVIDQHRAPPADWPKLKVTEHKVGFWALQSACGGGGVMVLLVQRMACAWIDFTRRTCRIYYAADGEHGRMAVEHENDHCEGRDHIFSSVMVDRWEQWKLNAGATK